MTCEQSEDSKVWYIYVAICKIAYIIGCLSSMCDAVVYQECSPRARRSRLKRSFVADWSIALLIERFGEAAEVAAVFGEVAAVAEEPTADEEDQVVPVDGSHVADAVEAHVAWLCVSAVRT
jgi:hypothetical protein